MSRISHIEIDDRNLPPPTPEIEQERKVAMFDLLEENSFALPSRDDRLVPPGAAVPARLEHAVRVVWVQDVHPGRRVSHTDLVADPLVYDLIRKELDTPR